VMTLENGTEIVKETRGFLSNEDKDDDDDEKDEDKDDDDEEDKDDDDEEDKDDDDEEDKDDDDEEDKDDDDEEDKDDDDDEEEKDKDDDDEEDKDDDDDEEDEKKESRHRSFNKRSLLEHNEEKGKGRENSRRKSEIFDASANYAVEKKLVSQMAAKYGNPTQAGQVGYVIGIVWNSSITQKEEYKLSFIWNSEKVPEDLAIFQGQLKSMVETTRWRSSKSGCWRLALIVTAAACILLIGFLMVLRAVCRRRCGNQKCHNGKNVYVVVNDEESHFTPTPEGDKQPMITKF